MTKLKLSRKDVKNGAYNRLYLGLLDSGEPRTTWERLRLAALMTRNRLSLRACRREKMMLLFYSAFLFVLAAFVLYGASLNYAGRYKP